MLLRGRRRLLRRVLAMTAMWVSRSFPWTGYSVSWCSGFIFQVPGTLLGNRENASSGWF